MDLVLCRVIHGQRKEQGLDTWGGGSALEVKLVFGEISSYSE